MAWPRSAAHAAGMEGAAARHRDRKALVSRHLPHKLIIPLILARSLLKNEVPGRATGPICRRCSSSQERCIENCREKFEPHVIGVFYPGLPLLRQVQHWAKRHAQCTVEPVFARSAPEMRAALLKSDVVLVDATHDHAQAVEAFSQALGYQGNRRTAVYSETLHDGLESFVRMQGSQLLFGPLADGQWNGFFSRVRAACPARRTWSKAA